ncbi:MAG: MFS transporter [Gemmatimonadota bacterium]
MPELPPPSDGTNPPPIGMAALTGRLLGRFGLSYSRNLALLAAAGFCMSFGMAAQGAVGNNFQVETLKMTAADRGIMEGGREIPGLLLAGISALTVALPVPLLAMLTVATMAVQYFGFFFVQDVWQLIGLVIFGSIGFHMWMPLSRELNLSLGDKSRSGRALGFMGGVGSTGGLTGMVMVWALAPTVGYRAVFLVSAVALTGAAVLVGRVTSPRAPEHERRRRLVFRREYGFYYVLNFLEGSARQIWGSFAMFTLVKSYAISVRTVTTMLIANSLLTVYMNPRIGAWIDEWGERKALMVGYAGLVFVFVAFAFTTASWQAIAVYFTYSTMFAFNMATPSYLHKIARPGELSPSLAMGVTAEHLAGVAIPVIGGMLWVTYGYRFAFLIGAAVATICFLTVTRLPRGRLAPVAEAGV